MNRNPSPLLLWLEPLKGGLWICFLFWTAAVALVWAGNIGDRQIESAVSNADLRKTIDWLIGFGDIGWLTLAALNMHGSLAASEGLGTARRWGLIACGGGFAAAFLNTIGLYPLEKMGYGSTLGMKFGPVPLGVIFLWFVLIIGARETALRIAPKAGHAQSSILAGALMLLTGVNLESITAHLRGFWFWIGSPAAAPSFSPPASSYAVWFVFGTVLTFLLREDRIAADFRFRSWKPVIIFGLLNAVFILANIGRMLRG